MAGFFTILALLLMGRTSAAFEVGDLVHATQDTDLRVPNGKTGSVFVGDFLKVESIKDKWLWVSPDKGKPGWIDSAHVVPADDAEKYFEGRIKKNSRDAAAYVGRAKIVMADFKWEKATEDLNMAVSLGLKTADIYATRGMMLSLMDEFEKALADFNEAIRMNPNDDESLGYRGLIWEEKGEYAKAHADYSKALAIDPENAVNCDAMAILLASCPDAKYRNGRQAVSLATKACQKAEWQNSGYLGTLAAAYAEVGDFKKAIEYGEKALENAFGVTKEEGEKKLALYKANKPYRHEVEK